MKQTIVSLCLIFLLPCISIASDRVIHITSGEWAPMTGEKLPHGGFVNHVAVEAFKRSGYNAKITYCPWPRAYARVAYGNVEASSFWYKNKAREEDCLFSDPVNTEEVVFFHLKGHPLPQWNELLDLKDLTFAVNTGVTYTDEFWALGHRGFLNFHQSNKHEDNFAKLLRGRVDTFPASKIMGLRVLKEHFPIEEQNSITYDDKPFAVSHGYLLFGKTHPNALKLVEAFNRGLGKLRQDGTYDKMLKDFRNGAYNAQ